MNALKEIQRFQSDRGLNKMPYDGLNEAISVFEEVLESLGYDVPKENRPALRANLELFIDNIREGGLAVRVPLQEEDIVDAICDQITFSIGALMKLGYDPETSLLETAKEINSRKGRILDGKFEKYKPDEDGYSEPYRADYSTCKTPLCSTCGSKVSKSNTDGYEWQCTSCDVDLYSFETTTIRG